MTTRRPTLAVLCLAVVALATAAQEAPLPTGAETPLTPEARQQKVGELRPQYLDWLRSVRGLISQPELDYFLRLSEDFRRDLFMRAFWEPRDPDRSTRANELKERWERFRDQPGGPPFDDPRFMLLLLNGPPGGWSLPNGRPVAICYSRSKELEIWFYGQSERTDRDFPVILFQRASGQPYDLWVPGQTLRPIQRSGGRLPTTNIQDLCAEEYLRYTQIEISRVPSYDRLLREVLSPPLPSPEWLANLAAAATDLPRGAETFDVGVKLDFPARKQSRTAVRVMLGVTRDAAPGRRFDAGEQAEDRDGELFHHFRLVGEVIRDGQLFESFRYIFEGPTPESATLIPVGFTRYLRPGKASLRLLLEDVYGGRFARVVRELDVPSPDGLPPAASAPAPRSAEGPKLQLYPPPGNVHVGKIRFRARATVELDKVTFYLDDQPVLSKRRPPYSVELDLGDAPEPRRVRVVGFAGDAEVATDQIWLNQGAQRFRAQLIEPRPGGIYPGSVTAAVQVDTPSDQPPARVELYLNDELAATLTEPTSPQGGANLTYSYPLTLPPSAAAGGVAVVRAVAYLDDGTSAEDAVVIGAAAFTDVIEVRLVELPVLVTSAGGEPITGLSRDSFRVFDAGDERPIERFEPASEAPLTAAVLIDRSVSMAPHLETVADAARAFAAAAVRGDDDRVAVFSFADDVTVDAGFSAGAPERERALAGLQALGGTAFYDGLVQAFNTFESISGAPALVLFTDGRDETSRLTFEQALDAARRAGVRLYAVGLEAAFAGKAERRIVEQLAEETGGRAVYVAGLEELQEVYLEIAQELRAGYLIAYQAPSAGAEATYRKVKVEVDAPGAKVRTRSGYYP